ncbi:MAG: hypothetical protein DHS20C15_23650 [Planctomycetota bacterium]|nr:MAG: hypothetical protein DHS20C15_23650 [Planctomycetota bacterium]
MLYRGAVTRDPPTLREQLPQIRRWSLLVIVSTSLTLLGGGAFGAWNLPKMATYVSGNFEVDDGRRDRGGSTQPEWRGRRGTEGCPGCRAKREVHLEGETYTVTSASSADVSIWIADNVPRHEHAWEREGCWTSISDSGMSSSMQASLTAYRIDNELWARFLQASEADDVPGLVRIMTHGGTEFASLLTSIRTWGEAHPVSDDSEEG